MSPSISRLCVDFIRRRDGLRLRVRFRSILQAGEYRARDHHFYPNELLTPLASVPIKYCQIRKLPQITSCYSSILNAEFTFAIRSRQLLPMLSKPNGLSTMSKSTLVRADEGGPIYSYLPLVFSAPFRSSLYFL